MSSDDSRISTEELLALAEPVHVDTLTRWEGDPYAGDVGQRALQSETFGQLDVVYTYGTEVLYGQDLVEAQRHQPDDDGFVPAVDLAKAGYSRIKAEAAADAKWAIHRDSTVDSVLLAELRTRIIQEDEAIALAVGFDGDDLDALLDAIDQGQIGGLNELGADGLPSEEEVEEASRKLVDRFVVPPFSVLDTRQGYWQDRKRAWLGLGMASEVGRGESLTFGSEESTDYVSQSLADLGGTSVFDPVICEIAYRWFAPPKAAILDPFAGGVVRGAVAARLGHRYHGVDLRAEQVEANREQRHLWEGFEAPEWTEGDSRNLPDLVDEGPYDLLFSCPPYADLEVYSDDPADLSTSDPDTFLKEHAEVIGAACGMLADNRFAVWVVSEVRHSKRRGGEYLGFVPATIEAFRDAGLLFYNEAILLNVASSAAMRVGRQFSGPRKLGRIHQNVLVFYKGDPANIGDHFPLLGEDDIPPIGEEGDDAG